MEQKKLVLTLQRSDRNDLRTIGMLSINTTGINTRPIFTLEDPTRDAKIAGETAIPAGVFEVRMSYSPRFKRRLPELISVPGFEYIRIHAGNSANGENDDTQGCILVGYSRDGDRIGESRVAEGDLCKLLDGWEGYIEIDIRNPL